MRMLIFTIFTGLVMTSSFAQASGTINIEKMAIESRSAANASLSTLSHLVTQNNARRMGFDTPGDAAQSQLDTPLSVFIISLQSLRDYQRGSDAMNLLMPTGEIFYPVRAGGSIRSSVTLRKQGSEWQAVSYGSPNKARALGKTRNLASKQERRKQSEFFEVTIPALNLIFVGHVVGRNLMLTSATDLDIYGVKTGVTEPAEEIFLRLKPEAIRHNGLPR